VTTNVQLVPTDKIRILNARSRSKTKHREITENIAQVGLKTPITVNRRADGDGFDLVCGQGRLQAYIASGATEIPAMVVELSLVECLLRSLVENLTRRTPSGVEMARDLIRMKERGQNHAEIAANAGVSETYVASLVRLIENGEDRLVAAVERGELPITAAIQIASTDDATMQKVLQEAYDSGELRGRALVKMRRIIDARRASGKDVRSGPKTKKPASPHDLVRALRKETHKQEVLVKKARLAEHQLRFVVSALKDLMKDGNFVTLLRAEKLDALPRYLGEMIQK